MVWGMKYNTVIGSDGFMRACFIITMFLDKNSCPFKVMFQRTLTLKYSSLVNHVFSSFELESHH